MDWISRGNSNFTLTKSTSDSLLKRSASTISLNGVKTELCLREAKSFTGALDEFRYMDSSTETENCQFEHSGNCNDMRGLITREVSSNQVFFVKDDMLTYRGKRYSYSDIALRWKKDCRMWLWKNKDRSKSISELQLKIQNTKLS